MAPALKGRPKITKPLCGFLFSVNSTNPLFSPIRLKRNFLSAQWELQNKIYKKPVFRILFNFLLGDETTVFD